MQFCQFGGFLGQKSLFRIFFENLKISEFFFFVFWKRIKLSAVCKKNHRNRTNGSGDNALRSKKIIEILRLFKKKFFSFRRKIQVRPQKMKNYIGKNEIFHPEAEKLIGYILRPLVFARYPISWKLAILQNGEKKFDFPEKQGKYPLWYIKLFVSYHWTKITHKNENLGPFVSPRVENRL